MDVRVLFEYIRVSMMFHVVLLAPVVHREPGKQWERQGSDGDVASFRLARRRMDPFMANHGDRGGDQTGEWEQQQSIFQREEDVSRVQRSNHDQQ